MLMKDVNDVYGDSGSTNLNTIIPGCVESEHHRVQVYIWEHDSLLVLGNVL